ncbi:DUF3106 domain-containing protein [Paucibacter sp. APW11]|uniref:DUF3106 domain-containing protein n=1 Tax=Roseateles aquae TaxID=3077235 RepID=A0ABU3P7K6_9BURK|nr:DUF3106 domain-containing protein [Paucibacter sp. APW11]MDT8998562.1 DUF3106 domain-containing protein [Paucibacter sp. APW11]
MTRPLPPGFLKHLHLCTALVGLWLAGHASAQAPAAAAAAEAPSAPDAAASQAAPPLNLPKAPAPKPLAPATFVGGPAWQQLSNEQRQVLSPLATDWDKLDGTQRGKWLELAARFHALPADEQQRVRERMSEWARLSPAERQQVRAGFQNTQQLKKQDLQAKWEAYQSLPPERRQELLDKAAQKKPPALAATASAPARMTKSNLVPARPPQPITAVTPSLRQAKPGATTLLITQGSSLPSHQQAGMPKVLANPELIDPKTLLPRQSASKKP